jgi:DNA replication protein DnaC
MVLRAEPSIIKGVRLMLTENTISKLHEMKLSVMAQSFRDQMPNQELARLSFEDRFSLIVDSEWASRKSNRLNRLIRNSEYAIPGASIENLEYSPKRSLDKALISRLSSCTYVLEANNVIILGATGVGKTHLASALGVAANRSFYAVKYIRLPDLLAELAISHSDGTYRKVMKKYKQVKLMILDEYLLFPLKESEALDLLEIVETRYKIASTIFCRSAALPGGMSKSVNLRWPKQFVIVSLTTPIPSR